MNQHPRDCLAPAANDKDRLLSLSEHLPIFLREPRFRRLRPCWPIGECTTTPISPVRTRSTPFFCRPAPPPGSRVRGSLFRDFLRFKLVTSDHRVAGSSPAECKYNTINKLRMIYDLKVCSIFACFCLNFALTP